MYRNHSYDSLKQTLMDLSETIPEQKNVFSKSSNENTLDVFAQYIELDKEKEAAGDIIYRQFTDLKADFEKGSINLKRYTEHLQSYKEFFNSNVEVKDLPKSLDAKGILLEIDKYLG